jgi:hypothetical protein
MIKKPCILPLPHNLGLKQNLRREDEKISKHLGRSSAASDQGSTNGSATLASDLTEQEANSLVLNIMQE